MNLVSLNNIAKVNYYRPYAENPNAFKKSDEIFTRVGGMIENYLKDTDAEVGFSVIEASPNKLFVSIKRNFSKLKAAYDNTFKDVPLPEANKVKEFDLSENKFGDIIHNIYEFVQENADANGKKVKILSKFNSK